MPAFCVMNSIERSPNVTPEEREKRRRIWKAYKLRKKAGLSKSQEQAERESMAILRANQAAAEQKAREDAAKQKREREQKEAERIVVQSKIDALNAICGTSFRRGQSVLVTGGRAGCVKGATPNRLLVHLFNEGLLLFSPWDVWSRVELSKSAVFEFEQAPERRDV